MAFVTPTTPNLADFNVFLATSVKIPTAALPSDSPWPGYAFAQAMQLTLAIPGVSGLLYTLAVYNCATHILFAITPDQDGQTYFVDARSSSGFNLINPSAGLVQAASDDGTSSSYKVPDWVSGLTIGQLGFYKTPWGREYLSFIQSYGPTIVGLT